MTTETRVIPRIHREIPPVLVCAAGLALDAALATPALLEEGLPPFLRIFLVGAVATMAVGVLLVATGAARVGRIVVFVAGCLTLPAGIVACFGARLVGDRLTRQDLDLRRRMS